MSHESDDRVCTKESKIAARYVVTNHCLNMHSAWFCLETLHFNMGKKIFVEATENTVTQNYCILHGIEYEGYLQMICDTSGSKGQ